MNKKPVPLRMHRPLRSGPQLVRIIKARLARQYGLPLDDVTVDPLEIALLLGAGVWPKDVVMGAVAGSKDDPAGKSVPINVRLEALKISKNYVRAPLVAEDPNKAALPEPSAIVNIIELMKNPAMRRQVESLQSLVVDQQRKALAAGAPIDGAILPMTIDVTPTEIEDEVTNGSALDERPDSDGPGEAS